MLDGMVEAIRAGVSTRPASLHLPILSYAAKYASGFYGPFRRSRRVAATEFGDRKLATRWTRPTATRPCA